MRSLQSLLLICPLSLAGCNGVIAISTGFHPSNTLVTVSGFISVIQITRLQRTRT